MRYNRPQQDREFLEFFGVSTNEEYWELLDFHALIETLEALLGDLTAFTKYAIEWPSFPENENPAERAIIDFEDAVRRCFDNGFFLVELTNKLRKINQQKLYG